MSDVILDIIIAAPIVLDLVVDSGYVIIPSYGPGKGDKGDKGDAGYTPVKGVDYFDGDPGYTPQKGVDYFDGDPGYTPVKGVDYFDGAKGDKGEPGTDATVTKAKVEEVLIGEINTHTHAADANKVDKVAGKTLTSNDLTDELKATYDGAVTSIGNILTILQSI